MACLVGIDFGLKRTGLSCTDPNQLIASGLTNLPTSELLDFLQNYCQEQEALREAKDEGVYTGPLLQEERIFTKKQEERIISFDVRAKFLFTEKWRNVESQEGTRQSVQVYTTEEQVRSAFDKRAAMLLRRGYTQAGSQ